MAEFTRRKFHVGVGSLFICIVSFIYQFTKSADAAFHLKPDEIVHLDCVFYGEFL